jgi:succinate dehydrogenase/fumarate reductase flavoprotein subunit
MDGVFDIGNNNILIAGANRLDHQALIDTLIIGDIAVYQIPQTCAIHRIIGIKNDGVGRYFKFKGDNNTSSDPYKIRDSDIKWISIGTIY